MRSTALKGPSEWCPVEGTLRGDVAESNQDTVLRSGTCAAVRLCARQYLAPERSAKPFGVVAACDECAPEAIRTSSTVKAMLVQLDLMETLAEFSHRNARRSTIGATPGGAELSVERCCWNEMLGTQPDPASSCLRHCASSRRSRAHRGQVVEQAAWPRALFGNLRHS